MLITMVIKSNEDFLLTDRNVIGKQHGAWEQCNEEWKKALHSSLLVIMTLMMQITNSSQAGNDEGRGEINRRVSSPSLSRAVLIGWTKSAGRAIPSLVAVQRRKRRAFFWWKSVPTNFKQDQLVDCEADAH